MEIRISTMLRIVAGLGMLSIVLGAFGAHSLKESLSDVQLSSYKTGVQYQIYHVLAMLALVVLYRMKQDRWLRMSFFMFLFGVFLFSGSLYLLSCRELIGLTSYKWLGPLTPIGGIFLILGWVCLFVSSGRIFSTK